MPARRAAPPPRGARLFGLAGLIVFALAFGLGFLVGRHWESFPVLRRAAAVARTIGGNEREAQGRRGAAGARESERQGRAPEPTPTLTFYQELTKPLAALPPPPKRERTPRPQRPEGQRNDPPATEASGAFTVQVAAYRTRAHADALRQSLAASGHDAYVVEAEAAGGMTYRVRVGAYATREAARAAAQVIGSERQLQTYVTAR